MNEWILCDKQKPPERQEGCGTVSDRLVRGGWSIEQALNAPTHKGVRNG